MSTRSGWPPFYAWPLLIAGMLLLAASVVAPARAELNRERARLAGMLEIERDLADRVAAGESYVAALERGDADLIGVLLRQNGFADQIERNSLSETGSDRPSRPIGPRDPDQFVAVWPVLDAPPPARGVQHTPPRSILARTLDRPNGRPAAIIFGAALVAAAIVAVTPQRAL